MDQLFQIIAEYGAYFYPLTFAWAFLEGESFVILAGAAAYHELLNLPLLILAAWGGSFAGDQFYFFIGRRYGQRILLRFPRWRSPVDTALKMLHKYHVGFILSFRFIYGIRNFSSFAMGMSELPWSRFLVLNFIAAGVWAVAFACAGYLLGHVFEAVLGKVARDFGLVMLALFLVLLSGAMWMHKRAKKREEQAPLAPPTAKPARVPELSKKVSVGSQP